MLDSKILYDFAQFVEYFSDGEYTSARFCPLCNYVVWFWTLYLNTHEGNARSKVKYIVEAERNLALSTMQYKTLADESLGES